MFHTILEKNNWSDIEKKINSITTKEVENSLKQVGQASVNDFLCFISPAAEPLLDEMASISFALTRKRFGNNINLFTPLYLSNECNNICTYCGFSYNNQVPRKTLTHSEIIQEIKAIKKNNFDNILLLTGEHNQKIGIKYFREVLPLFKKHFNFVALEVQPLNEEEYKELISLGLDAVYVYQETYNQKSYKLFHPRGKKSNFAYRLATPERLGNQKIHKIGLGILLGLANWRVDSFYCALHLDFLKRKYWQTQFSISFPRLRPASNVKNQYLEVSEKNLLQLIIAYRLFDENLDLSLSTRESPAFRDKTIPLGITTISAGSKTNPGGYANQEEKSLKQFEISDERSPSTIANMLKQKKLEPVWKDWDKHFSF